ncbi:hypothetical protein LCGC14_1676490 [marine sediment metagenome]|uniref:HNH domain-containing protein n=1 Tax=marine sediment metagenome TaxID=412755 RepID=A0A0F9K5I1_9ZZZZ
MEQTCTKCGTAKPLEDFHRHRNGKHGRNSQCKACRNKPKEILPEGFRRCTECKTVQELEKFDRSNRTSDGRCAKCKDCRKKYRENNRDALKEKRHQYYIDNREDIIVKQKAYVNKNRDRVLENKRKYYRDNIDKFRKYDAEHKEDKAVYWKSYYPNNRERIVVSNRDYRKQNPETVKQSGQKWRKKNLEKALQASRDYYRRHRIEILQRGKQYRAEHPEMGRYHDRLRKSRKLAVNENFTSEQDSFVRTYWGNECAICGLPQQHEEKALAIDHWYPLSKGHALTIGNAVLMCRACNAQKKDRYPDQVFDAVTVARIEAEIKAQEATWESRGVVSA